MTRAWKALEKKTAEAVGGRRHPRVRGVSSPDVTVDDLGLVLECKTRKRIPAIVTAVGLLLAIGRLFPDLGETRGASGLLAGGLVLGAAGAIQLGVTWGVASLLGVREISTALQPVTRRLRRRGPPRA